MKGLFATLQLLGLLIMAVVRPSRSGLRDAGRDLDDRITRAESGGVNH